MPPPPYNPDSSSLDTGTLVPSFLSQKGGGRFGFAPSTTTCIPPSNAKSNPQVLNDPYIAMGMNIAEKRNQNALVDHAHSSQPLLGATYSDNLDPALRKEDGIERQTLHARLVGSDLEDSESSGTGTDKDDDEDEEDKEDEGENNESQQFGWEEAHQRQKEHPGKKIYVQSTLTDSIKSTGFSAETLPPQARVTHPLTPDFQFQFSRDEDEDSAHMRLNNSSQVRF